jgi:hypothetical protein
MWILAKYEVLVSRQSSDHVRRTHAYAVDFTPAECKVNKVSFIYKGNRTWSYRRLRSLDPDAVVAHFPAEVLWTEALRAPDPIPCSPAQGVIRIPDCKLK